MAAPWTVHLAIFLLGAVGIAYQIALMRILSIAQWHHFAYMIISIAMLGFGASGSALALARRRIAGRERPLLAAAALLSAASLVVCYAASQGVPFDTFQLLSQPGHVWYLLLLYLILALPFFLISTAMTLGFLLLPGRVGSLYCANMLGSGLGAAGVVGVFFVVAPSAIPAVLCAPAALAFVLAAAGLRVRAAARATYALAGTLAIAALALELGRAPVRVSEYKALSYALDLPDARIVAQARSPLSVVTAVASRQIRETPGQIANYPMSALGPLPEQIGLYFDAGAVSPVSRFDGDLGRYAFLDYVTAALPYRLVERPDTLIVGAGGGMDVLGALAHGARHVTAVEVDPRVFDLVQGPLAEFAGQLYKRPDVSPVVAEGRGYLQSHARQYDLIQIPLLDSFNASAAGVHALNESYLYTIEAFRLYISRLTPNGVLAVTRWLKTPPRDTLKMFATMVEACEQAGLNDPAARLVFIRSWNTGTLLLCRAPLTAPQVQLVRDFCRERNFDPVYFPGIAPDETNQYTVMERPFHYEFCQAVLGAKGDGGRESLYRDSLFHLRPATDDCPYFSRFFRWASLPRLIRGMGAEWIPFVEWGYVTLVATIIQSVALSVLLILAPLFALRDSKDPAARAIPTIKRWTIAYFACLGVAYMFLEIAFIQRFMLFLAYPIYAVAVVLTAFLVFSGLGSLFSGQWRARPARQTLLATGAIAALAIACLAALPTAFAAWAGWSDWAKIAASVALLAPIAFCMGVPFPTGLQLIGDVSEPLLPWAWGINGCASVIGATLATFTAVHLGFRVVVIIALAVYFAAAYCLRRIERRAQTAGCFPAPQAS